MIDNEAPAPIGWLVMVFFFGILGGFCAQLSRSWGIAVFLGVGLGAIAIFAGMGYFLQFIVF